MAPARWKNHVSLWWENSQIDRRRGGKDMIQKWDKLVSTIRGKFITFDYTLQMIRRLERLKHTERFIVEYTEEFSKIAMRAYLVQDSEEKTVKFVNGLKLSIQREVCMKKVNI
jgi:N-glycosylase/DNA lyase